MNIFKNILSAIKNEIMRLYKDKKVFIVILFAPAFLISIYGFEFSPHTVEGINTVVIDKDNTSLSRKIVDGFKSCDRFNLKYFIDDENAIKEYFDSEKAEAAIVIPSNFMKDVLNKKSTTVLVVCNGNNMITANGVMFGAVEVVQTYSIGTSLKMMQLGGTLPETSENIIMPINLNTRIWYNPTFNYSAYLTIGLIVLIIQQICFMFTANSFIINRKTISPKLLTLKEAVYKMIGIIIVHFSINFANFYLCVKIITKIFDLPMRGSMTALLLLGGIFVLCICVFGILLSLICREDIEATQISIFFAVPSFLLSGYTWPRFMMIPPIKMLSNIFPTTYFVNPMRKIFLMGTDISYFKHEIIVLIGIVVVGIPLAILIYLIKAAYFSRRYNCTEDLTA